MSSAEDVRLELLRELRSSAQLQHLWVMQAWEDEPGLHPAAGMLLSDLAKHGEARPSEVAKRRLVDLSVISRQIAQLQAAGLIDRRPAPEDGRASLISVSEKGQAELTRWRSRYLEFFGKALGGWDEQRLTELMNGLASLNADLRATLGAPDNCTAGMGK
ncbi:MarR family winged helix-turn-helix transcriptional regulator [Amycolatopsis jiangsuensis]|uniref:DNA-binding MarR family transcriptional regulator n=1 Tax=Amycolatopsis jiangsuensis TaxID=1181879 RepID=A0A840IXQ9_9PSEU|nr:MarR family winged helix-turn-helix transcriptional regulator [Amycolatopsis jiangsuensis]MBB4687426.1 DNA-binding MarR family transcriptional regulator [Amycolatopsis jiangsuensis]